MRVRANLSALASGLAPAACTTAPEVACTEIGSVSGVALTVPAP